MTFRRFAGLLLAANAVLVLVMTSSFLWFTSKLSHTSDAMYAAAEEIATAHKIESGILAYSRESLMFEATGDDQRLLARARARDQVVRMLERASHQSIGKKKPQLIGGLADDIHDYFSRREHMERSGLDQDDIHRVLNSKLDEIVAQVAELVAQGQTIASTAIGSAVQKNFAADSVALSAAIIILACLAVSFFGIWILVFRPLYEINKSVELFRTGTIKVPPAGGLQEIRLLSETVSRMIRENVQNRRLLMQNIAAVAHDIKNPLSAIVSAADMAVNPADPNRQDFIEIISRQSRYLERIVIDLLETTRLETGNLSFQPGPCDLNQIVAESIRLFAHQSAAHRIQLTNAGASVTCLADSVRISQVINNLISNAIKYSPDGGDIDLSMSSTKDTVELTIADHGIGIAQEDLNIIFIPFQRSHRASGKFPGVGLGLATAKKIVEAHGGQLTVSSIVNHGSVFRLILPLADTASV